MISRLAKRAVMPVASCTALRYTGISSVRTLVYLRDGNTVVRGLKKDESLYLKNPQGVEYPGPEELLAPVEKFLGDEFKLPRELALQCITHKSFAHGKKPYNERLAILGRQMVRVETSRAVAEAGTETSSGHAVNGRNFDIGPRAVELLSSATAFAELCRKKDIGSRIFWKPNSAKPSHASEDTIFSATMFAIVGAVLLQHGAPKTIEFVRSRILEGPDSVFGISDAIFVNKD